MFFGGGHNALESSLRSAYRLVVAFTKILKHFFAKRKIAKSQNANFSGALF